MYRTLRWLPLLIFLILILLFVGKLRNIDVVTTSPQIGTSVPVFVLSSSKGENLINNDGLPKKTFLLNVWASWCLPCEFEHTYLKELSNIIPIVGLNYKDSEVNARNFLDRLGDPYEFHLFDPSGRLGLDLGVTGVPETFLVDRKGIIREHIKGEINSSIFSKRIFPLLEMKR